MTARSPTMVMLHNARFVECRWWNDGWTVKTVVTCRSSAYMIQAPGLDRDPPLWDDNLDFPDNNQSYT